MAVSTVEKLRAAFEEADQDGDNRLNIQEFSVYVQKAYNKDCPEQMYMNVCQLFKINPNDGITWNAAHKLWLQTQPQQQKQPTSPSNGKSLYSNNNPPSLKKQKSKSTDNPAKQLQDAFLKSDIDENGYLNEKEFLTFVKLGFNKSAPKGMYNQVCQLYKSDSQIGINWDSAFKLWKQSNQQYGDVPDPGPPKRSKKSNIGSLSKPMGITRTKSYESRSNHRKQKSTSIKSFKDDMNDNASDSSEISRNGGHHKNKSSMLDLKRAKTLKNIEMMEDETDASTMVVQMMEKKYKDKNQQYKVEKAKRQRFEERAQQLLMENEKYKIQLSELQIENNKNTNELNELKEYNRKYKQQIDDYIKTITHLKKDNDTMKHDRDESFKLLTKIEKDHSNKVKKLKDKHKQEMVKLSQGFLQSLGAEPGKDVRTVIEDLKESKAKLKDQVERLAELLSRKEKSLIEALSAVDQLVIDDEKYEQYKINNRAKNPLPAPPPNKKNKKSRNYFQNKPNSIFFKNATKNSNNNNNKNGNNNNNNNNDNTKKKNGLFAIQKPIGTKNPKAQNKQMQFVNQQLTNEINNKEQEIENLKIVNKTLIDQATSSNTNNKSQGLP